MTSLVKIATWVAVLAFLVALGTAIYYRSPMPLVVVFPVILLAHVARQYWGKGPE